MLYLGEEHNDKKWRKSKTVGQPFIHPVKVQKEHVVEIPRGTLHWAENRGKDASLVYAIFTPPFHGEDYRRARTSWRVF